MARKLHSRYKITGELITRSPLHIGGLGGDIDSDLALAVNGKGDYYIPGTSMAGALRNWMEIIDKDITNFLWGDNKQYDHASFILVEDSPIQIARQIPEVRDNVAIDRQWGTAVDKMKFDRMILPRGVKIPLKITIERPYEKKIDEKKFREISNDEWDNYQFAFCQLLNALQQGQISLGAAKTRGLGKVKLYDLKVHKQEIGNFQGFFNFLENKLDDDTNNWTNEGIEIQSKNLGKLEISIHWKPVSSVMVKAEGEGIAVDILPLVSGFNGGITFVLPGSSIKGALRTQSERILRTVLQKETHRIDDNSNKNFNDQIDLHLVKTLFGSPAKLDQTKTDPKDSSKQLELGYLGALSVDDCFAKIPLNYWSEVENATDESTLRNALDHNQLGKTQQSFHVAIDRWTGGAADSYLYTILEPMGITWYPLNLSIDLHRLKRIHYENEYYPCFVLLLLTLRDLINKRIPLGFGTNRGFGAIEISKINFKGIGKLEELSNLNNLELTQLSYELSNMNQDLLNKLNRDWQNWIQNQTLQEVN